MTEHTTLINKRGVTAIAELIEVRTIRAKHVDEMDEVAPSSNRTGQTNQFTIEIYDIVGRFNYWVILRDKFNGRMVRMRDVNFEGYRDLPGAQRRYEREVPQLFSR
tara:strand:- start:414 stop:731 length:318 start_codon:yes stop_codon:yes gene_type:complete